MKVDCASPLADGPAAPAVLGSEILRMLGPTNIEKSEHERRASTVADGGTISQDFTHAQTVP